MLRFGPYFEGYTPVGDISAIAVCFVMVLLMLFSYIRRTRSLRIFIAIIVLLITAASANVTCHLLAAQLLLRVADVCRMLYHTSIYLVFCLYAVYIAEVTGLEKKKARMVLSAFGILAVVLTAADLTQSLLGNGLQVQADGTVSRGFDIFMVGYIVNCTGMVFLLLKIRGYLYKRVMSGFFSTVALSIGTMAAQKFFGHSSFTVITFVFPVIGMFYIMHSNPYNVSLGAVDSQAMTDMVRNLYSRRIPFVFMSLYMPAFEVDGAAIPEEMQATIRRFTADYFRGAYLFQIRKGHILLLFRKKRNPDYEHRIENILNAFRWEYHHYKYDYKIVIGESVDEISEKNEYPSLIRNIHRTMKENTIRRVGPGDIGSLHRDLYVLRELADIARQKDPEDPRVLAYCQPVFNVRTGSFDTAEVLMRLDLAETGLVLPDHFIHLAEEYGFIHALTEIILHKACCAVRQLTNEGYILSRVSVNVSALEIRDDAFCSDITRVIYASGIPATKIAIELTESRSEDDFLLIKNKFEELRNRGITVYLDDFGTGYTNLERIVELPFDIIKFDRSMVTASGSDPRARQLLENLASIFTGMGYAVLFEGVESEEDEARCMQMSASYLQGCRYSHPVPIGNLRDCLLKTGPQKSETVGRKQQICS